MPTADIELTIARTAAGPTTAALRVELPSHRADLAPPAPITLDDTALRGLAAIPDAYGAALTAMVFSPAMREGWQRARGFAEGAHAVRVRLVLEGDDHLHALRWELLRDPVDHTPLAHSERTPVSRYLATPSLATIQAPTRPALRAVVAVASPTALPTLGMRPVDVPGELARAQAGLADIPATILDGQQGRPPATLAALADALRGEAPILYLVCHGAIINGQPVLYLEQEGAGRYRPTDGAAPAARCPPRDPGHPAHPARHLRLGLRPARRPRRHPRGPPRDPPHQGRPQGRRAGGRGSAGRRGLEPAEQPQQRASAHP